MPRRAKIPDRERGCDAAHRASKSDTHPTHGCMPDFRHFLGGRCARSLRPRLSIPAIQPKTQRAHGALREVFP